MCVGEPRACDHLWENDLAKKRVGQPQPGVRVRRLPEEQALRPAQKTQTCFTFSHFRVFADLRTESTT